MRPSPWNRIVSAFAAIAIGVIVGLAGTASAEVVPGDTLTVIQRPLVNLPAIVTPGSTLTINCEAPSSTTGWTATLLHGSVAVPLTVQSSVYDASTLWWTIQAQVPSVSLYELYDLKVTANGGITDTTWSSVQVIGQYLSDYYFIQITDTHLPTPLYYYEPGADTDSSSMVDLREIIKDANIINPAFVVITGDFINEGELEDYLSKKYFDRAQRILTEFDVPVYVTSGNHDIGGWDATPPPAGTARQNWWKFFGWKRLNNPPAGAPYYTQDYSFDYGPVHYVGLEAYLNYESWRPEIYGAQSFTAAQIQWLNANLAAASGSAERVLFFHSDYSNQINLSTLNAGLSLAGHTHSNTEDTSYPYKIITKNACNGQRTYRVIRVSNGVIQAPQAPLYAGGTGASLSATFAPANNGTNYTVTATVTNNLSQRFQNGRLRFVMPNESGNFTVTGGTLAQVDHSGQFAVCYVNVDILASSSRTVTVTFTPTPLVPPTVALAAPNGGETWNMGSSHNINWTATDDKGVTSVSILLSTNGGTSFDRTLASGEPNDGAYTWLVDAMPTSQARIKVVAFDADGGSGSDVSDASFTVADATAPVVAVVAPNGGQIWNLGQSYDITWTATDNVGVASVDLLLSRDGGVTYPETLATAEANDGLYSWYVTGPASAGVRVKVTARDAASNSASDASDADFEILDPAAGVGQGTVVPSRLVIAGSEPNPFAREAVIRFGLPRDGAVDLALYDVSGRLVVTIASGRFGAGYHEVRWANDGLAGTGLYFLHLRAGGEEATRKIVITR